jgi:outer membrane immunogenic protein
MKKIIGLALFVIMGVTSIASAADMAVKALPAPVLVAPSWTGWYIGVNAGGNWGTSNGSTSEFCSNAGGSCYIPSYTAAINLLGAAQRFNTSGFTGGIQGGYNWQSGNWVVGFETDFESFRSSGWTTVTSPAPLAGDTLSIKSSVSTDWLFTARPRLGIVTGNWLLYGTGGVAVTNLKANWSYFNPAFGANYTESASASATKVGWTVGAGVETRIFDKWSLGIEYLYTKFGSVSASGVIGLPAVPPFSNVFNHSADLASNIVRVRLNKLF